jgi:hypothetical protein
MVFARFKAEVSQGDAWAALEPVKEALRKRRGALSKAAGAGIRMHLDGATNKESRTCSKLQLFSS